MNYTIDKNFIFYDHNWYEELYWMECTHVGWKVQNMMTLYLLTNGIQGTFVGWIPDWYGRRKTVMYTFGASLCIQIVFIFNQDHLMRTLCFFCLALCNVKNGCAYVWAFESAGVKHKMFVTTIMNAFDRSTLFVTGFFLVFITRWWLVIAMFYWTVGVFAFVLAYFYLPESPLWLVMNNRNAEAIAIFNQMAVVNGSEGRIQENTEFTEMQNNTKAAPVVDDASSSEYSFIVSAGGDLSAASFAIHSQANDEQKSIASARFLQM